MEHEEKLQNGWYIYRYKGFNFWVIKVSVLFEHYGISDIVDRFEYPVNKSLWFGIQIDENGQPFERIRAGDIEEYNLRGTTKKGCQDQIRIVVEYEEGGAS